MLSLIAEFLAVFGQPMLELANTVRLRDFSFLIKRGARPNAKDLSHSSSCSEGNDNVRPTGSDRNVA